MEKLKPLKQVFAEAFLCSQGVSTRTQTGRTTFKWFEKNKKMHICMLLHFNCWLQHNNSSLKCDNKDMSIDRYDMNCVLYNMFLE